MDSAKDLIRDKLRIEDVIGSYITLIPVGKNYKACCPFHNEKTPSFQVNPDRQFYYCFGCKRGGDIFSFVQEIEHVDFKESLKVLAEKAGVDLAMSAELSAEVKQKKTLQQIHEFAARFYQLLLSKNTHALDYLKSRGLTSETIKAWRIGYAPDTYGQLVEVLRNKGFSDNDLVDSGLIGKGDRGLYDRFRGRIMFPITDSANTIIAFTGRLLPGTKEAERGTAGKYINSPETRIYHKSSAIFGFAAAKKSIAEKKSVIIVEGQFDAILLHQAGYTRAVALSGTACTPLHIEQLSRLSTEFIIATDSDYAGTQSAYKIAELGYQFGADVSVIMLPQGKDPADIIASDPSHWNALLKEKQSYIVFHGKSTQEQSLRDRIGAVEQHLFPVLARMENHVTRDAHLQTIAEMLKVSVESIRNEFQKFLHKRHKELGEPESKVSATSPAFDPLVVQIAELGMARSMFATETESWFASHPEALELLNNPPDISAQRSAEFIARYQTMDEVAWKIKLDTLWIRIQQIQIDSRLAELKVRMSSSKDDAIVAKLQAEMLVLREQKESLIRSLAE
jgi:DNA primase